MSEFNWSGKPFIKTGNTLFNPVSGVIIKHDPTTELVTITSAGAQFSTPIAGDEGSALWWFISEFLSEDALAEYNWQKQGQGQEQGTLAAIPSPFPDTATVTANDDALADKLKKAIDSAKSLRDLEKVALQMKSKVSKTHPRYDELSEYGKKRKNSLLDKLAAAQQ